MSAPSEETIRAALEMAREAPLANGTLPWMWWLDGAALHIRMDEPHVPLIADPAVERARMIGNGAALHHLRTALTAFGWAVVTVPLPDPRDPNHLAVLHFAPSTATGDQIGLAGAIFQRQFQHNRFRPWDMPATMIRSISGSTAGTRAAARHVPDQLRRSLSTVYRAAADRDGDYGEFLTGVAGRIDQRDLAARPAPPSWSSNRSAIEPIPATGSPYDENDPDSAELLILCTPTDDRLGHLNAGVAASSILLTAARNGLASSLLTQTMKVPAVREGLRSALLHECAYPHALIRLGRPDQSDAGAGYVQPLPGTRKAA
ncbi:hypothetical protein ACFYTS_18760 [Nocardia sp. NPDC004151]|uniref:hypothetical protein n=1 Tax=Nocardia sp. NPDC004151 TaxID=3364304 RepID=UPI0036B4F237